MRTRINRIFSMAWLIAFAFALLLSSCSKDDESVARDLLATVPSNASMVMLAEGAQMADKAGDVKETFAIARKNAPEKSAKIIDLISSVWTPTAAVVFSDGGNMYLTTRVDDPAKLRSEVEKVYGAKMAESGEIIYNGSVAIRADQVWVSLSQSLSANDLEKYTKLAETQSYASVDYCEKLITGKGDLKFVANINSMLGAVTGGSIKSSAITGVLTSMLFKGAVYAAGRVDFNAGEAVAEVAILDSKYHVAEFLIPVGHIDPATVKSVSESAEVLFAIALEKKTVDRLKELGSSLGGAFPAEMLAPLSCIDGTTAVAQGNGNRDVRGIVTTDGTSSMALTQMLSGWKFQTTTSGKDVIFTEGNGPVSGSISTAEAAGYFKGAVIGIAATGINASAPSPYKAVYVMLHKHEKGLKLTSHVIFPDKKKNALSQIVTAAAAATQS